MNTVTILQGHVLDKLRELPENSVHCVVTSPPYWGLRDYGCDGQIGLERTIEEYVAKMVEVFREVRRVLRQDGVCFLNLGDSYAATGRSDRHESPGVGAKQKMQKPGREIIWKAGGDSNFSWQLPGGLKPKDLCGIPWRVALALQADGWWLRSDIIWAKPNPMPESVTDRPTRSHEYIFLLTKSAKYFWDAEAVREGFADERMGNPGTNGIRKYAPGDRNDVGRPMAWNKGKEQGGRNLRSVWNIATAPFPEAHFATFPPALVEKCIKAGCPENGTILDPFMGSGTTCLVAANLGRNSIGIELKEEYVKIAEKRIFQGVKHKVQIGQVIIKGFKPPKATISQFLKPYNSGPADT